MQGGGDEKKPPTKYGRGALRVRVYVKRRLCLSTAAATVMRRRGRRAKKRKSVNEGQRGKKK